MYKVDNFINGESSSDSTESSKILNPSYGKEIGEVAHASRESIDTAIECAADAFNEWSKTGLGYRAELILKFRQLVIENTNKILDICISECGKTKPDAAAELDRAIQALTHISGVQHYYPTHYSQNVSRGIDIADLRYPIGVVAGVGPFNFPILIPILQSAMALATGNTSICKPSEKVPSIARLYGDLYKQAGLPDGCYNVLNGGKNVVEQIVCHKKVDGLAFIGSTGVAKSLKMLGIENNTKVQALGGGKNHMIVLPDADLDMAADAAVSASFGAAGQRCMAVSVVVAVGNIADDLVAKIKERIPNLVMGVTDDESTELGPVIGYENKKRIYSFIESAEPDGAKLVVDGRIQSDKLEGCFVGPTLIDNVKPGMSVYDYEIFGPVLSFVRADSYDHAMKIAHIHKLGNGAALFTRDGGVAKKWSEEIQAGSVGINVPIPLPTYAHSFGGWKDSGFSETKAFGPSSIDFYTKTKSLTTRWPNPSDSKVDLGFPKIDK
ncbi:CoA-acylating methylmalonate-semialdehyde dehydrogenase [SAR86 cluster bacterium]|jgi:malonate-semialdehyde dehydrogenase (acetylating)/methylmalonate-semialdehyde dehydrogenase|nr:CoA-acylating methylmalonate-semialdehyde dehydrogenase [SAR86 cluster bacterium]|tara:strand:- start:79 stop:1566 length:1488 start_codon:yes stop_codon:yes gene_type:complete